jgi:low affinity Fe/Cu permease
MDNNDSDRPFRSASMRRLFDHFALRVAGWTGSPWAFFSALAVLVLWGVSGPVFGFSDTWQLIINTSTTIVTFLMVFVIQHSENKNSRAVQIKLDELISVTAAASNRLIDVEDLSDAELEALHTRFAKLAKTAATDLADEGI